MATMKRFTITNRDMPRKVREAIMHNSEAYRKAIEKYVRGSVNPDSQVSVTARILSTDPSSPDFGSMVFEGFVTEEEYKAASTGLASITGRINAALGLEKGDPGFRRYAHSVTVAEGDLTLYGKSSYREAERIATNAGGVISRSPTESNPDNVHFIVPSKGYNKLSKAGKAAAVDKIFGSASVMSQEAIDKEVRAYEERERITEANEKRNEEKRLAAEEEYEKKRDAAATAKWRDMQAEYDYEQWEKEDNEAKIEKDKESKKIEESTKRTSTVIKSILAVVTVATDILRRILTSTLKYAAQIDQQAKESRNVEMSMSDRREMDIFDLSRGMKAGTTFGAVSAVQRLFGDITNLDEGALSTLARVMGGDVKELVETGIGGEKPEKLLETIMDKYFLQYKMGKNSIGQYVGQEAARRELLTSLTSVAPELAEVFAAMVEDYTRGKFTGEGGYRGWRDIFETNRTDLTEAEITFSTEVGRQFNEILAMVEDLKTSFFTRLANSMSGLLSSIANIRIGMSASKSFELSRSNYRTDMETKNLLKQLVGGYNKSAQDDLNEMYASLVEKKRVPGRFGFTAETLAGIASGEIDSNYLKKNFIEGSGMLSQSDAEIKAYLEAGKILLTSAILSTATSDEITKIMAAKKKMNEVQEQLDKGIEGNPGPVTYTVSEETKEAEQMYKDVVKYITSGYDSVVNIQTGEITSEEGFDIVKEAFAQQLRDNPTLYLATMYSMFGDIGVLMSSEAIEMANKMGVPQILSGVKGRQLPGQVHNIMRARYKKATAGKDLTPEEEKAIMIDLMAEAGGAYFISRAGYGSAEEKYIRATAEEKLIPNVSEANSYVIGAIVRLANDLAEGKYSYSSGKNERGEYVLTIVGKTETGAEVDTSYTLSGTDGVESIGTFIIDNGQMQFSSVKGD